MTTSNEELIGRSFKDAVTHKSENQQQLGYEDLRVSEIPLPAPFLGVLFNRLLTALDGEDFARLLPHMEFVGLRAGHEGVTSGNSPDYVCFPETAVLSHVYFLEDGSSTGAAIVGNDGVVGLSAILTGNRTPAGCM